MFTKGFRLLFQPLNLLSIALMFHMRACNLEAP
jgi:hypothetical protein